MEKAINTGMTSLIVEVLLAQAGTSDCELAAENLLSRTELYLSQTGISDLSPLSGLTNLTKLTLRENQIAEIRPLAELTNLQELFLIHNQIADVSPLARLTNLRCLILSEQPNYRCKLSSKTNKPVWAFS
jgi:internalin A